MLLLTMCFSPNIQARDSKMLLLTMCFSPNIQARDSKMLILTMCFSLNIQARGNKMLILTTCFSPNVHITDKKMPLMTVSTASGWGSAVWLQHARCLCRSLVFRVDGPLNKHPDSTYTAVLPWAQCVNSKCTHFRARKPCIKEQRLATCI